MKLFSVLRSSILSYPTRNTVAGVNRRDALLATVAALSTAGNSVDDPHRLVIVDGWVVREAEVRADVMEYRDAV